MNSFDLTQLGTFFFVGFIPFLFSLCFHEMAHAWMAQKKGDRTAELMGRLSMNPFVHADLVGTFILPLSTMLLGAPFFFGWAKPVPVNERNLSRPKQDMFWIALAGPLSNVLLGSVAAFICAVALVHGGADIGRTIAGFAYGFVVINMMLAVFNMIPLHPLDGGKVLARFLPYEANRFLEEKAHISSFILIGLFVLGALRFLGHFISSASDYLISALEFLVRTLS